MLKKDILLLILGKQILGNYVSTIEKKGGPKEGKSITTGRWRTKRASARGYFPGFRTYGSML